MELIRAIATGIAKTSDAKNALHSMNEDAWNVSLALHSASPSNDNPEGEALTLPSSVLPCDDGTTLPIDFDPHIFRAVYGDEYTGDIFPWHLVRNAMSEELSYFNDVVWEAADLSSAQTTNEFKLIRTKLVVCNKGGRRVPRHQGTTRGVRNQCSKERLIFRQHTSTRGEEIIVFAIFLQALGSKW